MYTSLYIYIFSLCTCVEWFPRPRIYSLVFVVWPQIKKKREKNQREKTNRDSFREECRKFLPTKLIVALR